MHNGLLWFDGNKSTSTLRKILNAKKRYVEKYGVEPNVCFVNPVDFKDIQINGMKVKSKVTIMKNHIWLGVTE